MNNKFRDELLENNKKFCELFNKLMEEDKIREYTDKLWDIILRDKTAIRINKEPLAFKDLFHQGLTEGRCKVCAFELLFLLDKFGIYSEAVYCENEFFKGTVGSYSGGHWYVEAIMDGEEVLIDTSLVITGTRESFLDLGHIPIKKYDIDSLFKENPSLIDYYEEMIINKTNL